MCDILVLKIWIASLYLVYTGYLVFQSCFTIPLFLIYIFYVLLIFIDFIFDLCQK